MLQNLHQHAVIEASAGTGKTHAIEEIVLRLLLEKRIPLDEVLLVTFTEKASGELKGRLRKALEVKLRENADSDLRSLLQTAIDSFDQASIFTIHGFCRRLLAEYALEQGHDLRGELVNDGDLVEPALREVQRRLWCQEFGPQLQQVLELADYNRANADKWEKRVCDLARKYREELGHLLRPAPGRSDTVLADRADQCRLLLAKLRVLSGAIPENPLAHNWYEGFLYIDMNHRTRTKKLDKFLEPLLRCLSSAETDAQPLRSACQFHATIKEHFKKPFAGVGFAALFEHVAEDSRAEIEARCPGLSEAIRELDAFRQSGGFRPVADQLAVNTVRAIRQVVSDIKAERGLFSFDDLIVNVDQALGPANPASQHLLDTLRRRFRYAIVDEFQDTDPLQWRILRRLFLEKGTSKLIVVGDPKQAIFGFRGADLPTYLQAAHALVAEHEAQKVPLATNWRTVEELLQPLNRLFARGEWFPEASGISYEPVNAPTGKDRTAVLEDSSGRAPLTLVNLQRAASLRDAHKQFAAFVAQEIGRLLAANIQFRHKGQRQPLRAGDICLLIFKRAEAEALVQALRLARLPFSFYKQTGLWSSTEAEHLGVILRALAAPDDRPAFRKALLTSFFRLGPSQLALCQEIPPRHLARVLFDQWLGHAAKRHWSALAQSLLEDTGILFHNVGSGDLDRRAANLRYLLGTLEEVAYRDNLDLLDLVEYYEKRRQGGDDLGSDFQPIETEQPKIQIMTIHASKGLEFPIVFLAGGFTKRSFAEITVYREHDQRVFDLTPSAAAKTAQKEEESAEYRRLLYVGLTRAMLKLYTPLVNSALGNQAYSGPVSTVLSPALDKADLTQLGPRHAALIDPEGSPAPSMNDAEDNDQTGAAATSARSLAIAPEGDLFPALAADMGKRRLIVRSFSSLHRAASKFRFGEETSRAEDEEPNVPDDPFRGPVFGEIVHIVLETIDFAAVATAADPAALLEKGSCLRAALDASITKHLSRMRRRGPLEPFHDACAMRVAEFVWNALRRPLPGLGGQLCDIPSSRRVHELEFLFPQHFGASTPAEVHLEEGFFTGFMDLVFRQNDLYYLVDWKTNDLEAYDLSTIARAMEQSDYHRQYRLYLHALQRWLKRRHGPSFDFLEHCGGVYYLFLRGMTGPDDAAGVFFHRPTVKDLNLGFVLGEARS